MLWKNLVLSVFLFWVGFFATSALAAAPVPEHEVFREEGLWLVEEGDGVFFVGPCVSADPVPASEEGKNQLCGWLVGMDYEGADPPKDIWGRSECNLALITGMYPVDSGKWRGHVLDPRSGHVYNANLWLDKDGNLKLRGYVGIPLFGQTATWTRYRGPAIGPLCHMSMSGQQLPR